MDSASNVSSCHKMFFISGAYFGKGDCQNAYRRLVCTIVSQWSGAMKAEAEIYPAEIGIVLHSERSPW